MNAVSVPAPSVEGDGLSRSAEVTTYVPLREPSTRDEFASFSANRSTLTARVEVDELRCGTARPLKHEFRISSFRFALICRRMSSKVANSSLLAG